MTEPTVFDNSKVITNISTMAPCIATHMDVCELKRPFVARHRMSVLVSLALTFYTVRVYRALTLVGI